MDLQVRHDDTVTSQYVQALSTYKLCVHLCDCRNICEFVYEIQFVNANLASGGFLTSGEF
jgi:hypothetical protein